MRSSQSFFSAVLTVAILSASDVFAAGAEYGADGKEKASGLPQMDPTWFASQIFWLVVLILDEARAKAAKLYQDIDESIKTKSEAEYADFQDRLITETQMVETKINAAKTDAMAGMNDIAADVAKEAAEKLVGIKPTLKDTKAIVQGIAGTASKKSKAA